MKTASDILRELKIVERPSRGGSFMTTCPECSHTRKKKNDRCLSVKVDALGVRYHCFHCPHQGGKFFDGGTDTRTDWRGGNGKAPPQPRNRRPISHLYR